MPERTISGMAWESSVSSPLALGLLVLGHQRRPVLELDAQEVGAFLELVHADAGGEKAFEVPADRRRRCGRPPAAPSPAGRGSPRRSPGAHAQRRGRRRRRIRSPRRQRQGDGEIEEVVLGSAGRGRELDAGLPLRARRCGRSCRRQSAPRQVRPCRRCLRLWS